jgi:hypothetical protein
MPLPSANDIELDSVAEIDIIRKRVNVPAPVQPILIQDRSVRLAAPGRNPGRDSHEKGFP